MFNHIVIGSNDLDRSKRFYDAVLEYEPVSQSVGAASAIPECRSSWRRPCAPL